MLEQQLRSIGNLDQRHRLLTAEDMLGNPLAGQVMRRRNLKVDGAGVSFDLLDPSRGEEVRQLLRDEDPTLDVTVDEAGHVVLALQEDDLRELRRSAVTQSIEIIRRRIDETGTREPIIQRQGDERIIVQLPGVDDPQRMKDVLGQTAKLTFHLADTTTTPAEARQGALPPGSILLPAQENRRPNEQAEYLVKKRVIVGGESLVGSTLTLAMTRELGPVLTALMVTGRAGSAMAAELGTMKVTQQIDALYTMSVNPIQ